MKPLTTGQKLALAFAMLLILFCLGIAASGCGEVTAADPPALDAGPRETVSEVAADALNKSATPVAPVDAGVGNSPDLGGGRVPLPGDPGACTFTPEAEAAGAQFQWCGPTAAGCAQCQLTKDQGVTGAAISGCTLGGFYCAPTCSQCPR